MRASWGRDQPVRVGRLPKQQANLRWCRTRHHEEPEQDGGVSGIEATAGDEAVREQVGFRARIRIGAVRPSPAFVREARTLGIWLATVARIGTIQLGTCPPPNAATTRPPYPSDGTASMSLPSSSKDTATWATRTSGAFGGTRTWSRPSRRTRIRTRPSLTHPRGPVSGEPNVAVELVWRLRTWREAWISSLKTTTVPSPRARGLAATAMDPSRFAGPSEPGKLELRIAPVKTTGVPSSR
jgi:hypothetical protein